MQPPKFNTAAPPKFPFGLSLYCRLSQACRGKPRQPQPKFVAAWVAALFAIAPVQTAAAASHQQKAPAPAVAPDAVRWNLADLYATPEAWSAALKDASAQAARLANNAARLTQNAAGMLATLSAISDAQRAALRLTVYAVLQADENLNDARAQERRQQTTQLFAQLGAATAWVAPDQKSVV